MRSSHLPAYRFNPQAPFLLLCSIIYLLLLAGQLRAQETMDTNFRYGAWVQGSYMMHSASFSKFTDVGYCCPSDFGSQHGFGAGIGGLLRFQPWDVLDKRLIFDVRLGLGYASANLSTTEKTLLNDPTNGSNTSVEGEFDYIISPSWMQATLDLAPTIKIVDGLAAHVGIRMGYLFADNYQQTEQLASDLANQGFVFSDTHTSSRNLASGSIPGLNALQLSLIIGAGWEIPLDREGTTFIAPEVFYVHGFTGVSSTVQHADHTLGTWKASSVNAGISIRFATAPTVKPDPCDTIINGALQTKSCPPGQVLAFNADSNTCFCRDTTTVIDSIQVRIDSVQGVGASGVHEPGDSVEVEGFKVRHFRATLPFVYFDRGTATLDLVDRYADITPQLRMSFQDDPSFEKGWPKQVLNIIGRRLFTNQRDTLRLVGYYTPDDGESENLAIDRAYAVRDYLYRRWNVGFDRMVVESGGERKLDAFASLEEGRCVELFASDPTILEPIEMPATIVSIRPSQVRISSTIHPGVGRDVASITYALRLGGGSGKRPKPLSATYNAGGAGFMDAQHTWTAIIGEPGSRIYDAVAKQMDADDLVLLPSLQVTFTNGQTVDAQQDQRTTALNLPIFTPQLKAARHLPDTAILVFDAVFTNPQSAEVPEPFKVMVDSALRLAGKMSKAATGVLEIEPIEAVARTSDFGLLEKRREAIRSLFTVYGVPLVDGPHVKRDEVDPATPMGAQYARAIRVVVRIPIR